MDLARLRTYLMNVYDKNRFVNLLQMKVGDVEPGKVELLMPVIEEIHTNLYGNAHGGSIASLADTAMGFACATLGKRVVTLEMNMNFIHAAMSSSQLIAKAVVAHNGGRTMVVECDIVTSDDILVAKSRGTFFIIGQFEGV